MVTRNKSWSVSEVMQVLEVKAPSSAAEAWDPVGLLVGDPECRTTGAVISVDLSREVVDRAIKLGYSLVINHHPAIFPKNRGLSVLRSSHPAVYAASKGVAVIAVHTNFDRCALEMIESMSHQWGLAPRGRLFEDEASEPLTKLVVYVPSTHVLAVREAVFRAGAGCIGNYDSCAFLSEGEGSFRGSSHSTPFLGQPGKLETVQETRLETVFPSALRTSVIRAMRQAHPYEEVAFDLFDAKQGVSSKGLIRGIGYGFWGEFEHSLSAEEFQKSVSQLFGVQAFLQNSAEKQVKRVAFSMGKGSSFWRSALRSGCDAFVTGELGYHDSLAAARAGLWVIELGHAQSEVYFPKSIENWLTPLKLKSLCLQADTQSFWVSGGMSQPGRSRAKTKKPIKKLSNRLKRGDRTK
jgi:dinuclear metal center YbgI/SA1388 family protein